MHLPGLDLFFEGLELIQSVVATPGEYVRGRKTGPKELPKKHVTKSE